MESHIRPVQGAYAALLIPRLADGSLDERSFQRTVEFLVERGIDRVVLNGATGEYCLTTREEFGRMLALLRQNLGSAHHFACAIGAPSVQGATALGAMAFGAGARAVLLPMPHFFPYSQEDISAYCRAVAARAPGPLLLYNLPRFTTPIEPETAEKLIAGEPSIAGIKDSGGTLDILRRLPEDGVCRIVGDDSVLAEALDAGVCDGVVSGVAGVLPELIRCVFDSPENRPRAAELLEEFIDWLRRFPVPWGLKLVADWRGIAPASFPLPLAESRAACAVEFREWFEVWWPAAEAWLASVKDTSCVTRNS